MHSILLYRDPFHIMKMKLHIFLLFIAALCGLQTPATGSTLNIPAGTKAIPTGKYRFNESIDTVILPASLTSIGMRAFASCPNLKCVIIPDNSALSVIPERCFEECRSLEQISLPRNLRKIDRHAFTNCRSLKEVILPPQIRTIGMNAFAFCESLKEIEIPGSVVSLDSYAFSSCTSLESASLPSNSAQLGELIFASCPNLKQIKACSKVPPKFECNSFLMEPQMPEFYEDCTLVVPATSVQRYKSSPGWSIFPNITTDD